MMLTDTPNTLDFPLLEIVSSSPNVVSIGSGERPSPAAVFCVGSISVALSTPAPESAFCSYRLLRYTPNALHYGHTKHYQPCHEHSAEHPLQAIHVRQWFLCCHAGSLHLCNRYRHPLSTEIAFTEVVPYRSIRSARRPSAVIWRTKSGLSAADAGRRCKYASVSPERLVYCIECPFQCCRSVLTFDDASYVFSIVDRKQ